MDIVKDNAFEYVSDQLRIFVINRLAQSPSSSKQLATSFSILVDDLTVTESSLDHVLDALVKAHIVDFDDVNGVRMYYLMHFDGDNIFDLNLEAVERLIVENDIPYYENTIPSDNDDLYFESIDDKICIHLNRPIFIPEIPIEQPVNDNFEDCNYSIDVEDINPTIDKDIDTNINNDQVDLIEGVDESNDAILEENALAQSMVDIERTLDTNDSINDDNQTVDSVISEEIHDSIVEENTQEFISDIQENTSSLIDETEADSNENNDIQNEFIEEKLEDKESVIESNNNDDEVLLPQSTDNFESSDNSNDTIDTEELKKAISEDIDFSSPIDSIPYSTNNATTTSTDDFFDSYFADYLPKESTNSPQKEDVQSIEKEEIEPIKDTFEVDDKIENDNINNNKESENVSITFDDNIGDNIVFTSELYVEHPESTPEADSKRIEEALRKLDEYSKSQEKSEEIKAEIEESKKSDEIEFYDVSINELIHEKETKPIDIHEDLTVEEQDKTTSSRLSVKSYIEEQELINNYDWEKKLSRVFIDSGNDLEEETTNIENNVIVSTYSELKDIMEKKNYKFKAYSNYDSVSFYSQNYVFSNRINKTTSIYTYLFMLIEIIIGYLFVDKYINKGLMPYLVLAIGLLVIPVLFTLKYVYFKDKRKPANFHFSISIVTALMVYVNLMVMVVLLAFFVPSLNVSINDLSSMIATIFYPASLLLAIPFSVCVYSILYSSKKYHLH